MYQDKLGSKFRIELSNIDSRLVQLLDYLTHNSDDQGIIVRNLTVLAKDLHLNRNTVCRLRKRLINMGYLKPVCGVVCLKVEKW